MKRFGGDQRDTEVEVVSTIECQAAVRGRVRQSVRKIVRRGSPTVDADERRDAGHARERCGGRHTHHQEQILDRAAGDAITDDAAEVLRLLEVERSEVVVLADESLTLCSGVVRLSVATDPSALSVPVVSVASAKTGATEALRTAVSGAMPWISGAAPPSGVDQRLNLCCRNAHRHVEACRNAREPDEVAIAEVVDVEAAARGDVDAALRSAGLDRNTLPLPRTKFYNSLGVVVVELLVEVQLAECAADLAREADIGCGSG